MKVDQSPENRIDDLSDDLTDDLIIFFSLIEKEFDEVIAKIESDDGLTVDELNSEIAGFME